jgi:hypothetical protein
MDFDAFAADPAFHSHVARTAEGARAHALAVELPRPARLPTFPPSVLLARCWAVEVPATLVTTSAPTDATVRPGAVSL